jgi:hypothetical protein
LYLFRSHVRDPYLFGPRHSNRIALPWRFCHHHSTLDLIALRDRLGPGHSVMHDDIVHLFRCSKCGSKKIGFILHVDTRLRLRARAAWSRQDGLDSA